MLDSDVASDVAVECNYILYTHLIKLSNGVFSSTGGYSIMVNGVSLTNQTSWIHHVMFLTRLVENKKFINICVIN